MRNDPWTSHEAERLVTQIPEKEKVILEILKTPMMDEEMIRVYRSRINVPWASESGLRTLRVKLFREGLLEDTGATRMTRSNRHSIVWKTK